MLSFENEKLKQEISNLNTFFKNGNNIAYTNMNMNMNTYSNNNSMLQNNNNNININIKSLKSKIEELEDLLTQYKNTNSPIKIIDLEETILIMEKTIEEKEQIVESLKSKYKEVVIKSNSVFDEKQAIVSLSQTMRNKDIEILNLKNQMKNIKSNDNTKIMGDLTNSKYILIILKIDSHFISHLNHLNHFNNNNLLNSNDFMITSNDKTFNPVNYIEKIENIGNIYLYIYIFR
jgi:hypothetical protein